jgi:hypothetical protein
MGQYRYCFACFWIFSVSAMVTSGNRKLYVSRPMSGGRFSIVVISAHPRRFKDTCSFGIVSCWIIEIIM